MDDEKMTPEERAAEREHYKREDRLDKATHLAHSAMQHGDLSKHEVVDFLRTIHGTLTELGNAPAPTAVAPEPIADAEPPKPAVPVKKSVTDEHLVSLIDGTKLQMLGRHLTKHGHTPDSYRAAYGLPADYPMVAASYSRKRAALAKAQGLGAPRAAKPTAKAA